MTEAVLNYFKAYPSRNINYTEVCYFLSVIDASVVLALKQLVSAGELILVKNELKGWRRLFVCRLADKGA